MEIVRKNSSILHQLEPSKLVDTSTKDDKEVIYIDALVMEDILRLLICGTDTVAEALQIALMAYQSQIEEERLKHAEDRSDKNE